MFEEYHQTWRTKVRLDAERVPRDFFHEHHFVSNAGTAQLASQEYLHSFRDLMGTKTAELYNLHRHHETAPIDAGVEYRFHAEKPQFDTTTVAYYQTVFGLPIWEAGLAVHMKHGPFRIVGSQATRHAEIQITKPSAKAVVRLKKLNAQSLAKLLGIAGNKTAFDAKSLRVLHQRLMIYRYEKSKRFVRPQRRTGKA